MMNPLAAIILLWPTGDAADCQAVRAIDGDTVRVTCEGWPPPVDLRVYGIDTPERGKPGYRDATEAMRDLLSVPLIVGEVMNVDKYGRLVVALETREGVSLGCAMVRDGYAIPYPDPRYHDGRYDECRP